MTKLVDSAFFEGVKFRTITKLEQRVIDLNICPACHTKTLKTYMPYMQCIHPFKQCTKCFTVYMGDTWYEEEK